ncbi:MAG: DUF5906 domain-containing protein [Desulfotignum sp.]
MTEKDHPGGDQTKPGRGSIYSKNTTTWCSGQAQIQDDMSAENLALFREILHGRQDAVAVYWKSKRGDKSGYSPLCNNKWDAVLCNIKKKIRGGCSSCSNTDYIPLSDELVRQHLTGKTILGIYPLLKDNTCQFIAADFDRHKPTDPDPWNEVQAFLDVCEVHEIPAYVLRSKSGNGYHVYLFFRESVEAWKARGMAFALLQEAGVTKDGDTVSTFDRLFPNQNKLSGKGLGNLISMPFQGAASRRGHTLLLDPATDYKDPYPDQWGKLENLDRISSSNLDGFVQEWEIVEEKPKREGSDIFKPYQEGEHKAVFSRIKNGCPFIKHCCDDAEILPEPEWYAFLTIVSRCKDGRRQAHKLSEPHPAYDYDGTESKIEHALTDTGPYLCETIKKHINKKYCNKCAHLGKISTPLRLGEQAGLDDYYTKIIADMNQKHAVIQIGGKTQILSETIDQAFNRPDILLSSVSDFRHKYANKKITDPDNPNKLITIANYWFEHPERREFEGLIFDPGKNVPGYYNLWRGLSVDPIPGDWSLFKNHIHNVISGGNAEIAEWVMAWLARIVQDPGGERPGTAIVLRGKQGTGKGIFVNTFGSLLGCHFIQIAQAGQITGRFNHQLKDVVLVFVDEGFWAGDKQAEGVLKNMITEPHINIEQKGKDIIRVKNNVNLIMASNNEWVVPAGLEERRFFVLDVSDEHIQDKKYFAAVVNQMNNGGLEAMLHDLLEMDISGIDLRTFQQTEGLFEQKLYSMSTVQKYWYERLRDGTMRPAAAAEYNPGEYSSNNVFDGWPGEVAREDQYRDYQNFVEDLKDRYPLSAEEFGMQIKKLCPCVKQKRPRISGKRTYVRIFPGLQKCREDFEKIINTTIKWEPADEVTGTPF